MTLEEAIKLAKESDDLRLCGKYPLALKALYEEIKRLQEEYRDLQLKFIEEYPE